MTTYYNEIDPFAAAWLRELIKAGHIAPGDVDERSIEDVRPDDIRGYTQCHFFAGIGVWSYALRRAGWPDNQPVWTGSCPCQPFSRINAVWKRGKGRSDERHLWPIWFQLIQERRPTVVFGEQVKGAIAGGWLDEVFDDMERHGYACGAAIVPALSVGSPQERERLWLVCDTDTERRERLCVPSADYGTRKGINPWGEIARTGNSYRGKKWYTKPGVRLLVDGAPAFVEQMRGYGNAINAEAAVAFIESYLETEADRHFRMTEVSDVSGVCGNNDIFS